MDIDKKQIEEGQKEKSENNESINWFELNRGFVSNVLISKEESEYLNKLSEKNVIAQFTIILSIYSLLLKKYFSSFDGGIISRYNLGTKTETSAVPLTILPNSILCFKEYLELAKDVVLDTYNTQDFGFNGFRQKKDWEAQDISLFGLSLNHIENPGTDAQFHMSITWDETGGISGTVSYLEEFVPDYVVRHFMDNVRNILINLEDYLDVPIIEIPVLTKDDLKKVLYNFNDTSVDYPKNKTVVDLFEEQVLRTPNKAAIVFLEKKLSYFDLNAKANQLANFISTEHSIKKGSIIGVLLPKTENAIISLLAVLKLGAVYLPLDINYPKKRIEYSIKDSGLKLLISNRNFKNEQNIETIVINPTIFHRSEKENIKNNIYSKDLAYVIYTSGSTGKPKGVMVEHRSNVNMSLDQIRSFEITSKDNILWFASVAFDASISEIMMSLYSGATLIIPSNEITKDGDKFLSFINETKSSVATFPPSYLALLTKKMLSGSGLRCIITAGESAIPSKTIAVLESGIDCYNAYGPTECAVCVSIYKITENDTNRKNIPIGRPIANTQIYILDKWLEPVSIGVVGNIYVSGVGLSKGYINKPELTAQKFITNPFIHGVRMYETGDVGRWLPDGNIEFIGRKDNQVKIRGHRIELGEIENVILQYSEDLEQVVVEAIESENEKVIVVYWVSSEKLKKSDLRDFVKSILPNYMIPSFYVELDEMPLTSNGKIDRKALPDISDDDIIRKEYIAPRNLTESALLEIWKKVLNIEKIGVMDDFFELGGNSLLMTKMLIQSKKKFDLEISFSDSFSNSTICDFAKLLDEKKWLATEVVTKNELII